jgi:hypothetical protein
MALPCKWHNWHLLQVRNFEKVGLTRQQSEALTEHLTEVLCSHKEKLSEAYVTKAQLEKVCRLISHDPAGPAVPVRHKRLAISPCTAAERPSTVYLCRPQQHVLCDCSRCWRASRGTRASRARCSRRRTCTTLRLIGRVSDWPTTWPKCDQRSGANMSSMAAPSLLREPSAVAVTMIARAVVLA